MYARPLAHSISSSPKAFRERFILVLQVRRPMLRALPGAVRWKIPTRTEAKLNVSQGYPNTHRGRWARHWGLPQTPLQPAARLRLPLTSSRPDYGSSIARCELPRDVWIFRENIQISKHHAGQPPHRPAREVSDLPLPSNYSAHPQSQVCFLTRADKRCQHIGRISYAKIKEDLA